MWRIEYFIIWSIVQIARLFSKDKADEIWESYWLEKKAEIFSEADDPISKRDNAINIIRESILENMNNKLNELENDKDFERFLQDLVIPADGKSISLKDLRNLNASLADQYAKALYTMSGVTGIQISDGKNDSNEKVYALSYTANTNGNRSLIIDPKEIGDIKSYEIDKLITYLKFIGMPHIVGEFDICASTIERMTRELLTSMMNNAEFSDGKKSKNMTLLLNMESNEIAQKTYRGCGNTIIIDRKDVDSFMFTYWKHSNNMKADPHKFSSYEQEIARDESREIPFYKENTHLKYEFTLNNRMNVYSSDLFDELSEDDANAIILYNGNHNGPTTDSGFFIYVKSLFGIEKNGPITMDDVKKCNANYESDELNCYEMEKALNNGEDAYKYTAYDQFSIVRNSTPKKSEATNSEAKNYLLKLSLPLEKPHQIILDEKKSEV